MKKSLFALIGLFLGLQLCAQDKLTPEFLWDLARISEPIVSPDGKKVIFGISNTTLADNKTNRDLFILEEIGGKIKGAGGPKMGMRQLTDFPGGESNSKWRPDGLKIGFLSSKSGASQLWEINLDGSNPTQVTTIEGGISNFEYSPNGKYISYTADVKMDQTVNELYPDLPKANARIIDDLMYRHWSEWHDYAYSHIFIMEYENGTVKGEAIDILKGEKFDSPVNPFGGGEQIAWTKDSKSIVYSCKKESGKVYAASTNTDLYQYDLASQKTKNLTEDLKGYDLDPGFSPDGKWMAWQSMPRAGFESDKNRLMLMNLIDGTTTDVSTGFDQSCEHLRWSSDSKKIFFTSGIKATVQLFEADIASKKMRQITQGRHNLSNVEYMDGRLIALKQSMDFPSELWSFDIASGAETALTTLNTEKLNKVRMGQVEERWVTTTDGKKMLTWVIYPPDFSPDKKYPALLYCQGGPQSTVNQFFSLRWNFQLMAANGYIVIAPNRRGLPSFGQEWNDQISGDWGGQCMKDYLSAVDEISKDAWIDKGRVGAIGASFGGYSVYYLAGIHQKRFKTFISHCGLFNLESWYTTTEEMFFANWDLKGNYWQSNPPQSYAKFDPHKLVGNWDTPMLVIHGEKDFRVPITQGMEAFGVAQLKGIQSKFLYFPEEGHWVLNPQNSVLWHRVFFEWLETTLKGGQN